MLRDITSERLQVLFSLFGGKIRYLVLSNIRHQKCLGETTEEKTWLLVQERTKHESLPCCRDVSPLSKKTLIKQHEIRSENELNTLLIFRYFLQQQRIS